MWRPLGKMTFFCLNGVFLTIFPLGRSNWLQITKNNFLRFLAFYPLISMFHALWHSSWRRTFRDLSIHIKNSSFHAVWLGIRKSIENQSKIYRKSIEMGWIWGASGVHLGCIWGGSGVDLESGSDPVLAEIPEEWHSELGPSAARRDPQWRHSGSFFYLY